MRKSTGIWARFLAVAVLTTAACSVAAQEPSDPHAVQPERPTVATHAGTVAPGWVEVESGVERDEFNPGALVTFTPTVLKIGVASHVQLGFSTSAVHTDGNSGMGDFAVGVKWRLLDHTPVLGRFAILPSIKFPTGSLNRGFGTGTTDASMLLISSHELGPVAMDVNVGATRHGSTSNVPAFTSTLWTASFGGPIVGQLGWAGECYGYPGIGGAAGQSPIVALLAGPTLLAKPWLAFDLGVIVPLAGPQPHSLYAGGVYNIGKL